jgi:hypothetical protein
MRRLGVGLPAPWTCTMFTCASYCVRLGLLPGGWLSSDRQRVRSSDIPLGATSGDRRYGCGVESASLELWARGPQPL